MLSTQTPRKTQDWTDRTRLCRGERITAGWQLFRAFYQTDQTDPSDVADPSDASSGRVPLHSG